MNADELSERERDILHLMCKGLTNEEIAQHLYIARQTVKNHVVNIFLKLGVRNRVSAVVIAFQQGVANVNEIEVIRE